MKFSNKQKRLLKEIKKQKILFLDAIDLGQLPSVEYLESLGVLEKKKILTGNLLEASELAEEGATLDLRDVDLYIRLTQKGEAEVDNFLSSRLEKINQWIPIVSLVMSILAILLKIA